MTFAEWIYVSGLALMTSVRVYHAVKNRSRKRAADWETPADKVLVSLAGLGILLPLLVIFARMFAFADYVLPAWAVVPGVTIYAAALGVLWNAHRHLAGNWSARLELSENHSLVTTGVYSRVRHPMYTAHLLWGLAQPLLVCNWIAGPSLLALMIPMTLVRIPIEERMMTERFGDEYREYMKRTGRLLPRFDKALFASFGLLALAALFLNAWLVSEIRWVVRCSPRGRFDCIREFLESGAPVDRVGKWTTDWGTYFTVYGTVDFRETWLALPSGPPAYVFGPDNSLEHWEQDSGEVSDSGPGYLRNPQEPSSVDELRAAAKARRMAIMTLEYPQDYLPRPSENVYLRFEYAYFCDWLPNDDREYYLWNRVNGTATKTDDFDEFLRLLAALPEGVMVDHVSTCGGGCGFREEEMPRLNEVRAERQFALPPGNASQNVCTCQTARVIIHADGE